MGTDTTTNTTRQYSASLLDFIRMARRADYLILDAETTGLHDGEVVSIAIINAQGETLLNTLVKPSKPIPADATAIHGITDDDVKDAPEWGEIIQKVINLIEGQHLIIYNAEYDRQILHNSTLHRDLKYADGQQIAWYRLATWHCAMEAFAEIHGEWNNYHGNYRWQKLTTAAKHYNLKTEGAHGALQDCLMTWGVVKGMCEAIEVEG